ncbi:2-hydroxyacid dehydrogenase [Olsenella sp. YH-ols2217]|uniref:2-hydroxyacid dehydrogenase n=1 Tax=Kribbibacterium absianum TaxID=3044210 RepID=A0ABT6ZL41_9ACTN|nr:MULTISPECIES: 2-hydroxyacid dehydrogenase [unclassified Olsenella]MDJ1121759.1 2-hydroxyacid dehydrogenase [Olsenella sp. YH-ols2216]MDJ1129767.1 2-hydroxyacid dehydrogenase [Olsenella sp. YH-ols2217]
MRILFYDTMDYDKKSFEEELKDFTDMEIEFIEADLNPITATLAKGFDAVCGFVNSDIHAMTLEILAGFDIKLVLMRCAGFDAVNVDVAKELGISVLRVPGYSPEAIAEHAMGLALAADRHIVKGYNRVRENDYALSGLLGTTLYGKTAGIVGTGKIGAAMCNVVRGFGMKVLGYDVYENPALKDFVEYVDLDTLLEQSDLISLHCPLFESNYHMIDAAAIEKMKPGVIFVNTARGGLVDTQALIDGIRTQKIGACGLDVYEEEGPNVFKNRSSAVFESVVSTLCSFPNTVVTSHQAFFTKQALAAIARTTLSNGRAFANGELDTLPKPNIVC